MNKIFLLIKTLFSYAFAIVICCIFIPPCLLIACLPAKYRYNSKLFFWLFDTLYKLAVWGLFVPTEITGKENIPDEPVIFAPNHQSSIDIPIVGSMLDGRLHTWLVLEYYASVPILGFFVKRMFVPVNQDNAGQAARSLIKIFKAIKNQQKDMIIFPEGGRYNYCEVQKFFEGFAVIAKKTGRAVVPIFMPNNGKIYPPGSFMIYYYPLVVIVGKPIKYMADDTDESFTCKVRGWFLEENKKFC